MRELPRWSLPSLLSPVVGLKDVLVGSFVTLAIQLYLILIKQQQKLRHDLELELHVTETNLLVKQKQLFFIQFCLSDCVC